MNLFTESVVLRFRGEPTGDYDDLGNPIIGPDVDKEWPAWYEPRSSTEAQDAREQVVSGYMVYLPLGAPLGAADAVVIDGLEHEVQGRPARQPGGFIVEGYQIAAVDLATG